MSNELSLLTAPKGFIPNCDTHHDHVNKTIKQVFKGGKVRLEINGNNTATAYVNDETVGNWSEVTTSRWSDILYTVQTQYSNLIG